MPNFTITLSESLATGLDVGKYLFSTKKRFNNRSSCGPAFTTALQTHNTAKTKKDEEWRIKTYLLEERPLCDCTSAVRHIVVLYRIEYTHIVKVFQPFVRRMISWALPQLQNPKANLSRSYRRGCIRSNRTCEKTERSEIGLLLILHSA